VTSTLRSLAAEFELAGLVDENGLLGNPKTKLEDGLVPRFSELIGNETHCFICGLLTCRSDTARKHTLMES
jgi:hypothetical protein